VQQHVIKYKTSYDLPELFRCVRKIAKSDC